MPQIETRLPSLSSAEAKGQNLYDEYMRAYQGQKKQRWRLERLTRAFSGLNGGAWDETNLQRLSKENRDAMIFNITKSKCQTMAGFLASDMYDATFNQLRGRRNTLIDSLGDSYYIDKELMGYEEQIALSIQDTTIMCGEVKLEVTRRIDGLPRIAIVRKNPAFIIRDPYWISENDKDCEQLWEVYYLTAAEIMSIYGSKDDKIRFEMLKYKQDGGDWSTDFDFYNNDNSAVRGHLFRVIEKHYLKHVDIIRAYGRPFAEFDDPLKIIPFPLTNDDEILNQFMVQNNIDPTTLFEMPHNDREHNVVALCPELTSRPLEDDKSEIQCGPWLPYFHTAFLRINGESIGVADGLLYIQQNIDKGEMKVRSLLETSGGGAKIVKKEAFPRAGDMQRFEQEYADESSVFYVDGDVMEKGKIVQTAESHAYDPALLSQLERMWSIADRISQVPMTMEAMVENSNESGVLFSQKSQANKIALTMYTTAIKALRARIAEAYMYQWMISYTGVERELRSKDGKKNVVLNQRIPKDNKIFLRNVPEFLPRCSVSIVTSPMSPTKLIADRAMYVDLYKASAQTNPQYASMLLAEIMRTFDMSEETKAKLEAVTTLQEMRDFMQVQAEIANLDANTKAAMMNGMQAYLQLKQMGGTPEEQPEQAETEEQPDTAEVPASSMSHNEDLANEEAAPAAELQHGGPAPEQEMARGRQLTPVGSAG